MRFQHDYHHKGSHHGKRDARTYSQCLQPRNLRILCRLLIPEYAHTCAAAHAREETKLTYCLMFWELTLTPLLVMAGKFNNEVWSNSEKESFLFPVPSRSIFEISFTRQFSNESVFLLCLSYCGDWCMYYSWVKSIWNLNSCLSRVLYESEVFPGKKGREKGRNKQSHMFILSQLRKSSIK